MWRYFKEVLREKFHLPNLTGIFVEALVAMLMLKCEIVNTRKPFEELEHQWCESLLESFGKKTDQRVKIDTEETSSAKGKKLSGSGLPPVDAELRLMFESLEKIAEKKC